MIIETIYGQIVAKANHYMSVPGKGGAKRIIKDEVIRAYVENPLKVVPLIHSNLTPVKFSHSPFCLFLFSSYSSCPLCRVLH